MSLDLSILVTTSAVPSHPSIEMILNTIKSFELLSPNIKGTCIFIAMDGYKNASNGGNKLKSGKLTDNTIIKYEEYKNNLRAWQTEYNSNTDRIFEIILVDFKTRHGFAGAVFQCLSKHITSKNVLITQHDWVFTQELGHNILESLIDFLNDPTSNIHYIGFQSPSTVNYHNQYSHSPEVNAAQIKQFKSQATTMSLPLMPLHFWYDRNHLITKDFYLDHVFGQYPKLKTTSFLEDTFGHIQANDLRQNKDKATFDKYGSYLYYPNLGETIYVAHVNGRKLLTQEQKQTIFADQLAKRKG